MENRIIHPKSTQLDYFLVQQIHGVKLKEELGVDDAEFLKQYIYSVKEMDTMHVLGQPILSLLQFLEIKKKESYVDDKSLIKFIGRN